MKKIKTLFKKDPKDLGRVINVVDPQNEWVMTYGGIPTRKFDGTSSAIIDGDLYKRFDLKPGRKLPSIDCIPCQEADEKTGHHPHWVKCERENPADKYHFEAFDKLLDNGSAIDGTYELLGPKVQGNPESYEDHTLVLHGSDVFDIFDFSFDGLRKFLEDTDVEGIVFHHPQDGRMCKIRKSDFGIKR